jgi:hypothetical protein
MIEKRRMYHDEERLIILGNDQTDYARLEIDNAADNTIFAGVRIQTSVNIVPTVLDFTEKRG